jgi:Protein of unknown function (DUF4058)
VADASALSRRSMMASPFPGMDPYLEDQGYWKELHSKFVNVIQEALAEQVPDSYEVRLEERLSLIYEPDSDLKRNIWPDVAILGKSEATLPERPGPSTLALEPITLPLRMYQTEELIEHRIEIRRFPNRELVTVVELLSPSNKEPPGERLYLEKHFELIHQAVHLVELDFLICGKRMPIDADLPSGQYFAFVSRAEWRPMSEVYAWSIRDPLPTIRIPLLAPDPDVPLELASIFKTVYERARFQRSINYQAPLGLPIGPVDRTWAETIARKFDQRRAQ